MASKIVAVLYPRKGSSWTCHFHGTAPKANKSVRASNAWTGLIGRHRGDVPLPKPGGGGQGRCSARFSVASLGLADVSGILASPKSRIFARPALSHEKYWRA